MPIQITDNEFLRALFGEHATEAVVTQPHKGFAVEHWNNRPEPTDVDDRYYTVSLFDLPSDGKPARRKELFQKQVVLGFDDVDEKYSSMVFAHMPPPTYVLESSPGSFQYGWALQFDTPEALADQAPHRLEHLHREFFKLYCDGIDPGQSGVTRVLRLPSSYNCKSDRIEQNGGTAPKCQVWEWNPGPRYTLSQLAGALVIDLSQARDTNNGEDTLSNWPSDSPLVQAIEGGTIQVHGEKEPGVLLVECPNRSKHTLDNDGHKSGALFLKSDGTGGYRCHHGNCNSFGYPQFLKAHGIEAEQTGWMRDRKTAAAFADVPPPPGSHPAPAKSVTVDTPPSSHPAPANSGTEPAPATAPPSGDFADYLKKVNLDKAEDVEDILAVIFDRWGRLNEIQLDQAAAWLTQSFPTTPVAKLRRMVDRGYARHLGQKRVERAAGDPFADWYFVTEANKFYNAVDGSILIPQAFDTLLGGREILDSMGNPVRPTVAFSGLSDEEKVKRSGSSLIWLPVPTVEAVDPIVHWDRKQCINTYRPPCLEPVESNSYHLNDWLGLVKHQCGDPEIANVFLDHMAFTLQSPEQKISWQVFIWGIPRNGKTMLVAPLNMILGSAAISIDAKALANNPSGYGDHFKARKVIILEEVSSSGDHNFFNSLKTKLANSDDEILNIKGGAMLVQPNRYSMYLLSNYGDSLNFDENDLKLLVIKTPSNYVGFNTLKEAERWYDTMWKWLRGELPGQTPKQGAAEIYHHLLNRDLTGFNKGILPIKTEAYIEMSRAGRPDWQTALSEAIEDKEGCFALPAFKLDDVNTLMTVKNPTAKKPGNGKLARFLEEMGCKKYMGRARVDGGQKTKRFWSFDNLSHLSEPELYEYYQRSRLTPPPHQPTEEGVIS